MKRPRHPNKHIEAAVQKAIHAGWRFEKSQGHAWGILFCTAAERGGCRRSVYSTPRNPEAHAKDLSRAVDNCPHEEETP